MKTGRKKRSKTNPERLEYLSLLVNEFQVAKSRDAQKQVLANLANFAYDPYNYNYFRQLNVLDIFLTHLLDADETIVQFAIGGLCNLCLDPVNKDYIIKNNGIKTIMTLLGSENESILISAVSTLMFLVTPESREEITCANVVKDVIKLSFAKDTRIKNLAEIFLGDYCTREQVEAAQNLLDSSVQDIPLPVSQ